MSKHHTHAAIPVCQPEGSFVVGLDCSTTGTKAIAFDRTGKIAARGHEPIPLFSPLPHHYEQDPNDWWSSTQKALQSLTRTIKPAEIAALAISNQRETFVPLSVNGSCLRPAIVWLDERCKDEVEAFSKKVGRSEIHRITGKPADFAPVAYRLAWMKNHEPDLYSAIHMICDVHTYLVWKLTGAFKTSWASADPLGLFDLRSMRWSTPILKALALTEDQVPKAYRTGTILGGVSPRASELTGLQPGALIVAGGGDGQAAGSGANALTPGRAYLNLGTAVVAGVFGTQYRTGKAFRTMSSCAEQGYYYECSLRAGTFAVDWFITKVLNVDPAVHTDIYGVLEREAGEVPAGSDGLLTLPYFCGAMNPYWDMDARGAFVGLSASHTRGHFYRSILEGIVFELLFAVSAVEKSIGRRVEEFVAIGGGARNELWCHIFADITGRRICIPENTEASGLGAAMAAAVGAGWYRSIAEAAHGMTGNERVIEPDKHNHRIYQRLFRVYKGIYPSVRKLRTTRQPA